MVVIETMSVLLQVVTSRPTEVPQPCIATDTLGAELKDILPGQQQSPVLKRSADRAAGVGNSAKDNRVCSLERARMYTSRTSAIFSDGKGSAEPAKGCFLEEGIDGRIPDRQFDILPKAGVDSTDSTRRKLGGR